MITLELTTLQGKTDVQIPSGWHEVSYEYYVERIQPFLGEDKDPIESNIMLVNSILGTQASEANVMEFGKIIEILLEWMEDIPEVTEFVLDGEVYNIPSLGKANGDPFMTVGDFENANDAMKFLQDSHLDHEESSNIGLIILCAIARGSKDLDDVEFARRLKAFQSLSMDVILSACFFFLRYTIIFEKVIQRFSIEQTKAKAQRMLPSITLDGLRLLSAAHNQVYLRSLHVQAQS